MAGFSCRLFILIAFFAGVHCRVARIVGGQEPEADEYSYTVSVQNVQNSYHLCNGIAVGEHWVLTTKNCVDEASVASDITIRGGSNDLSDDSNILLFTYVCQNIEPHETADIALLKVDEDLGVNIVLANLPNQGENLPTGQSVIASGYGETQQDGVYAQLFHVSKHVMTRLICEIYTGKLEVNGYFCTIASAFRGLCNGDEGSPLVYADRVIGMATNTHLSCGDGYPEVYIKLSTYRNWIDEEMDD